MIRPISGSRRRAQELYKKLRRQFLAKNPICCISGKRATEIHHKRGRIGTLLIDVRFWVGVSRTVHEEIHRNPSWARACGLLAQPGQWNKIPRDAETDRLKDELR